MEFYSPQGEVQVEKVWDTLSASRTELATALGYEPDQLRPERLTGKAKERVEQIASALEFVSETFGGDINKTLYWIRTPNLNLGNYSPKQLILRGKFKKVLEFIEDARTSE
jgi:uncharacterized protein (DUF2384 family)